MACLNYMTNGAFIHKARLLLIIYPYALAFLESINVLEGSGVVRDNSAHIIFCRFWNSHHGN